MAKKHVEKMTQKRLLQLQRQALDSNQALLQQNADCARQINEQAKLIEAKDAEITALKEKIGLPVRRHLPVTRAGVTHKFSVGGHEGYMTVGVFEDGTPGELFITMAKEGSTVGGLMDTIGRLTSVALQYGVSIDQLATKFFNQRFEPSGFTANDDIKQTSSIIDYVFRWLHLRFVEPKAAVPLAEAK